MLRNIKKANSYPKKVFVKGNGVRYNFIKIIYPR